MVELRACLSADVTTPAAVAEAAVGQWMDDPELRGMLVGNWERIGVGFDWGCPKADAGGVVLVVVMAGGVEPGQPVVKPLPRGSARILFARLFHVGPCP